MKSKLQLNKKAGIYLRLSKDDEKAGDSLSIENQRYILQKYVSDNGMELIDEYVDDGYSETNFDRPEVQRLLEDAKSGAIDTIIVKDLSRFGRNYIFVGQYVDYIFPMYNVRFIAISDNVDTANANSAGMDMMPIMNVFNEWHSANTSKKIRAVTEANAKAGKYRATHAPYGYVKGPGDKALPVRDEPAATVVRRIFEMRASCKTYKEIYTVLNDEKVPIPAVYLHENSEYHTEDRIKTYGRTAFCEAFLKIRRISVISFVCAILPFRIKTNGAQTASLSYFRMRLNRL